MLYIPTKFKEILEKDQHHNSLVLSCITMVTPWLNSNKTIFFPEYTDHGFIHLNEVLLTTDGIITDKAKNLISSEDVAAMVISTVLHDCAMHLTESAFLSLINDKFEPISSRFVKIEPKWSVQWADFMREAKRFDSKKLYALFGDINPVKDLPENDIDFTKKDLLLIGEFIRQHHARIAHEVALNGIPGIDGRSIKLFQDEADTRFFDLCGFIARSHNMDLRNAVDCLEESKKQEHLKVHVPFIMLVLRISDFIQIHSERAEKQLLKIKRLISPISHGEWKKHHAVIDIIHAHADPEAIFIDAEPEDVLTFASLKKLFANMQHELDRSWSVLGEIYGRYKEYESLGINIRRVRSTLDDEKQYIETKAPKFIPKLLKLKTANAEMIDLLIAPLYGERPEVGIRELLQNSLDACIERRDLELKQIVHKPNVNSDFDIQITLTVEEDRSGIVEIKDHGIGMTLDVIENYFLNIGASFRNSITWKKNHVNDGNSTVHRTGRFGIGLLAAYLLGDELEIITALLTKSARGLIIPILLKI